MEGEAGFFRSHLSSQKRLPIFRLHTRISLKKYLFGTAPPDPRLESGAGAVPNGPLLLRLCSSRSPAGAWFVVPAARSRTS
jgi:hypothetical protein